MAQEGTLRGELLARAKRAAARAAAEEEAQYEEEAAAGDISGTESVNDEEDAGVAGGPHWRCGRSGALQCEDEAEEVEVAVEVTSEEYEPSDGPSGEPDNEPEPRDRWRERAPQRGRSRSRPRHRQMPSAKRQRQVGKALSYLLRHAWGQATWHHVG